MRKFYLLFCVSFLFVLNANAQTKNTLSEREEEAMAFLKAYMPLSDIADYDEEFFVTQVKTAFQARDYFDWGKTIPEEIFRHFVLVYRVNNENLDSARLVFFNELKDRVKNMSMYDAALEVNHWCHEYVNYKGSDGRTSSPLATIRTSHGRCGEESTFTVTALRAVSIPARQCYTPRWAHTDDNHAWVEVWIDGSWYHLGACEPEPELNIAWFDAPAKRTMMVHTTVFGGNYKGPEEVNYQTELYSKINLLPNYAKTKKIYVKVSDYKGNPVKDADVDFGLYNYAEFYPIAQTKTDSSGLTYLTTGFGDLVIWANKQTSYAYKKVTVKDTDTLSLVLMPNQNREYEELFEVSPPIQRAITTISGDKLKINTRRLLYEDSIRNAYIATFPNDDYIKNLSLELPLFDANDVAEIIKNSWGNYKEIEGFLRENKNTPEALDILKVIYEKDLRDTPKEILQSHLDAYLKTKPNLTYPKEIIDNYILNPRIQLELITSWREYINENKKEIFLEQDITSPLQIGKWIKTNINLNTTDNYYGCQISPKGVIRLEEADQVSMEILFVAMARTFFFPAKYDWATGKAMYYDNGEWIVALNNRKAGEDREINNISNGKCILNVYNNTSTNRIKPEYSTHFTLAKFVDGKFQTLDYEYDPKFKDFPEHLSLESGYYRLLTGNRANDGTVYIKTNYFYLKPDRTYDLFVELREISQELVVEGVMNMKTKVNLQNKEKTTLAELSNGKGLVIAIIDPDSEPTKHIMVDIPLFKKEFEQWQGGVLFLVPDNKLRGDFSEKSYKNLPEQSLFAIDKGSKILKQVLKATKKEIKDNLPIILLITNEGNIVFLSDGYRIGSGENLIKTIYQIEEKK
ncbi:MAG: transglutaminase-like domain-containing protein [Bacteroidales bacterium]|nr:transglutaminase-like domain-containing protein [Bacteroidales bacterium]